MDYMPYKFKYGNEIIEIPKASDITWANVLNKPSSFSPSTHTHSVLTDRTNGTQTYLNYGAAGLSTASWLAAWNGYELRAISPSVVKTLVGVADTGWVNCTYASNMSRYSTDQAPLQVRKIGKIVHLRGTVKNINAFTPTNDSSHAIGTIPSGYRPAYDESFITQGSGSNRWMMTIKANGYIYISRYTNNTTINQQVPAGSWLNCFATWLID